MGGVDLNGAFVALLSLLAIRAGIWNQSHGHLVTKNPRHVSPRVGVRRIKGYRLFITFGSSFKFKLTRMMYTAQICIVGLGARELPQLAALRKLDV